LITLLKDRPNQPGTTTYERRFHPPPPPPNQTRLPPVHTPVESITENGWSALERGWT
jgi:hypothetical protein